MKLCEIVTIVGVIGTACLIGVPLLYAAWKEYFCIRNNPFPLFNERGKRFKEIKKYKTRSILQDIN